jgi:hypothetical protein
MFAVTPEGAAVACRFLVVDLKAELGGNLIAIMRKIDAGGPATIRQGALIAFPLGVLATRKPRVSVLYARPARRNRSSDCGTRCGLCRIFENVTGSVHACLIRQPHVGDTRLELPSGGSLRLGQ